MQVDSKVPKQLKKFLKKNCGEDKLAVVDPKLGKAIASKLGLDVTSGAEISELTRGIRSQMEGLVSSLDQQSMTQMSLGLSHSLSRYKLKFSPDKIDTMVVQAIGLLDELDKELNTYAMRVREWCVLAVVNLNLLLDFQQGQESTQPACK
jgi:nucleolar protein 58